MVAVLEVELFAQPVRGNAIGAEQSREPEHAIRRFSLGGRTGACPVTAVVLLVFCHSTLEMHMFMKRKLSLLQAVLWTGLVLAMMFPLLGLLGPRPGAPPDRRSFGIGDFWLIRIVETATPAGASWVMESNWLNIALCAIVGGVAIAWRRSTNSGNAEQSGEREPPMTWIL